MSEAINYAAAGPLTDLGDVEAWALAGLPDDALGICRSVSTLVVQPDEAKAAGLPDQRLAENQLRPAGQLVKVLLALEATALVGGRSLEQRGGGHMSAFRRAELRVASVPRDPRPGPVRLRHLLSAGPRSGSLDH